MQDLTTFFYAIGIYNIIGGLFMFSLLNENFAQKFSRLCEIFTGPYKLGNAGALWLWWAAILNTIYGVANVAAIRWGEVAQMDLMLANIFLYGVFLILTIFAHKSETYARGLMINFPLFGFWFGWALYVYTY